ncbi:UNVERIFIED_CONTAM: hypothetical protein RMT77_017307 [Armadillidium vulgare]
MFHNGESCKRKEPPLEQREKYRTVRIDQHINTIMGEQPLLEETEQGNNETEEAEAPEEIITFREIRAPEETLILKVSIDDQPQIGEYTAFVDTGAEVSLISAHCFHALDSSKYPLMSTAYRSVEGIGKSKFPVIGEAGISLRLSDKYTLRYSRFIIIPDEITEYDIVIGYDILKKEHLLPDPFSKELVIRRGNKVQTVAIDLRKDQACPTSRVSCIMTENVVINPREYKTIEIGMEKELDHDQVVLVDSSPGLPRKVTMDPALIKFQQNRAVMMIRNEDERPKKLRKGCKIGEIELLENPDPSIGLVEINEMEKGENQGWTPDRIMQDFMLEEANLSSDQKDKLISLLARFPIVLSTGDSDVGCTSVIKHTIETLTDEPVQVPVRRLQGPILREIEENCRKMEEGGIIRSKSPYSVPVVPIRKKDGTIRLCIDYRELNKITKGDSFPIPNLVDMLFSLQGMKFFCTIDLVKGYYQVEMEEESIEKTAFTTPLSHWEFLRMPFGVKNGPATFQRGMRFALAHIPWNECMVYLDDVLIISETFEKHLEILEKVLEAFKATGFKIKPSKTFLLRKEVQYLGHKVSEQGMVPLDTSLKGIMSFPIPRTIRQLRHFWAW